MLNANSPKQGGGSWANMKTIVYHIEPKNLFKIKQNSPNKGCRLKVKINGGS